MRQVPNSSEDKNKLKAAISLLLLSLALLLLIPVSHATPTSVTISGQVSVGSVTVNVRADASAPGCMVSDCAASLSGHGTDSPPPGPSPPGNPAACQFPLTGSISGSIVTLSGSVTQSSVAANIGTPVKIIADASSGTITFMFGTFTLTGSGTVVMRTA